MTDLPAQKLTNIEEGNKHNNSNIAESNINVLNSPFSNQVQSLLANQEINDTSRFELVPKRKMSKKSNNVGTIIESKFLQYAQNYQQYSPNHQREKEASNGKINIKNKSNEKAQSSTTLLLQTLKVKLFANKLISMSSKGKYNRFQKHLLEVISDKATDFKGQPYFNKAQTDGQTDTEIKPSQNHLISLVQSIKSYLENSRIYNIFIDQLNQIPVISPSGTFKFIWDIILMIVIIAYLFMIPIGLTFFKSLVDLFPYEILLFCNIVLFLDLILQWNFGYFEKGLPNMNRIQVMSKYFKSQLYLDLASSIFIIVDFFSSNKSFNALHLLFFLRFKNAKLFFKKIEERFNLNPFIMQLSSLVQLLLLIVTVSHLIGCVWISVSKYESNNNIDSWISDKNIQFDDWLTLYIFAYYYSTVTMITVGYGDFRPVNNLHHFSYIFQALFSFKINSIEMVVSIITMLISCGVFAYSINAIGTIFNSLNKKHADRLNHLYTIGTYMEKKNINFELQVQIKEYLEYCWDMQDTRDIEMESNLIGQLSSQLKEKLLHETFKMIIQNYPIFKQNFSEQFMMNMITIIQECSYRPEEIITSEETDEDHSIYFIESGKVSLFMDEEGNKAIKHLKKGDHFGDISFFTGQSTIVNAKAVEFTQIFQIKRSQFIQKLLQHPSDHEIFCNIQDSLLFQNNYEIIGMKCFICSQLHPTHNCLIAFPSFNKLRIVNLHNKTEQQNRDISGNRDFMNKYPTFVHFLNSQSRHMQYMMDKYKDVEHYYLRHIKGDEEDDDDDYEDDENEDEDEQSNQNEEEIQEENIVQDYSFDVQKEGVQEKQDQKIQQPIQEVQNEEDETISNRTLNVFSSSEQCSPDFKTDKLAQLKLQPSRSKKQNVDYFSDRDEKESPFVKTPLKLGKKKSSLGLPGIFSNQNPNYCMSPTKNNSNNLDNLSILNLKKYQSNPVYTPLSKKRNLIKIQEIQTNFHGNSSPYLYQNGIKEGNYNSPTHHKSNNSPSKIKNPKIRLSKMNIYDLNQQQQPTIKQNSNLLNIKDSSSYPRRDSQKSQSTRFQQIEQSQNINEIAERLQQLIGIHNKFQEQKDNNGYDDELDIQKNFEKYLPHNNLPYIIGYMKFKSKYIKSLKNSQKNNLHIRIQQVQIQNHQLDVSPNPKHNHLLQYPFGQNCSRKFQFLRLFYKKVSSQILKKKEKAKLNSHQLYEKNQKSNRGAQANTRLQRLLQKYEYLSSQEESDLDTITNNQDVDFDDIPQPKKISLATQPKSQLANYKQSSFYSKQNNPDPSTPNSQLHQYFENKRRFSLIPQNPNFQNDKISQDLSLIKINFNTNQNSFTNKIQSILKEEDEDIDSPDRPKFENIHQTSNLKSKDVYFSSQDMDNILLTSLQQTNRSTIQQELQLNNLMKLNKKSHQFSNSTKSDFLE